MSPARLRQWFIACRAGEANVCRLQWRVGVELAAKANRCPLYYGVDIMQYVKCIEGSVKSKQFDLFENNPVMVTVHDTDTGTEAETIANDILYEFIVGVGTANGFGVVVTHTTKTAMLHKHIAFAETTIGSGTGKYPRADYCVLVDGGLYSFANGSDDHDTLSVNISDNAPEVAGILGSIVRYIPRLTPSARMCTLYDYLGYVCRSSGVNIFNYKTIHLYSELRCTSTVIKLAETDEAKRFFMKMYLDVSRKQS